MISVDEALRLVEEHALPLASRRVPLAEARGLVLAESVTSGVNSPPYDKAQMDGYAVSSSDDSSQRQVVELVAAGDVPHHAVIPGTAVRIMTGAPLPDGADAVVPFEETEEGENTISFDSSQVAAGWHVAKLGNSVRVGQVVAKRGIRLRPVDVAMVAEVGLGVVEAVPRPRVAILPTGNELVPVGHTPPPGQISNSNGPLLCAAAEELGCEVIDLGIGHDDSNQLKKLVEQGLQSDVLLISGGVSAGDFDLVPGVLDELGIQQVFHRIALRPGRPLWFGVAQFEETEEETEGGAQRTLVFGLPGNPVSSYVCFELFVRPALAALAGRGFEELPEESATLAADYTHRGKRTTYLPAVVEGEESPRVTLEPWHGSGDLAAVARANCLLKIPAKTAKIGAGEAVQLVRI